MISKLISSVDKDDCLIGQPCVTPKWKLAKERRVNDQRDQYYEASPESTLDMGIQLLFGYQLHC